jgi:hypothetical protein
MPDDPSADSGRELFQEIAWRDFILWAHGEPEMVNAWTKATGRSFSGSPANPLEAMIDRATGKDASDAEAFVLWVTEHCWGSGEAPAAVRARLANRAANA